MAAAGHTIRGSIAALTKNLDFTSQQYISLPIGMLLIMAAFFADPRSKSKRYETIIFVIVTSSEIPAFIWVLTIDDSNVYNIVSPLCRVVVWCLLFRGGLRILEKVATFDDERVSKFIKESVLANIGHNFTGILFVTFKSLNCVKEERDLTACYNR